MELIAVRHGQSLANLRMPIAEAEGRDVAGLPARDSDVPLTALGRTESQALGVWLTTPGNVPTAVLCSPYARARETYQHAVIQAGMDGHMLPMARVDDRLRDRGMGVLQLLTTATMRRRFPEESVRRTQLGPHLHRPPGGENMIDVSARVAAMLADIRESLAGERVLLVTHDAVVAALRGLIDGLDEQQAAGLPFVPTGSVTRWARSDTGLLQLEGYGETGHLAPA